MEATERIFTDLGGRFIIPIRELRDRLLPVRAFVLDWDGVFNSGEKTSTTGSSFSEVDSMGLNLLRYAYYLVHGKMPVTLVISGEKNESAFHYCEREGLTYSFYKIAHKIHALEFLCEAEQLEPSQIAYFFDDVLDVPIAARAGVRIQVNQRGNPLFVNYCIDKGLADYVTASPGGQFALREGAEMLMSLYGKFIDAIEGRIANTTSYQEYLRLRRETGTRFYTLKDSRIELSERP